MAISAAWTESPLPRGSGESPDVHVAVGGSFKKGKDLILWALRHFSCKEVVLVHVHKPSPTIPTPLGNIPVKNARDEIVSLHRKKEYEKVKVYLSKYSSLCRKEKVKDKLLWGGSEDVAEGLLQLITMHSIRKLVMGTKLDNCRDVKKRRKKEVIIAKNAPPSCEIWFVKRGKHVWTQGATEFPCPVDIEQASSESPGIVRDFSFGQEDGYATSNPAVNGNERGHGTVDESDDPEAAFSKELVTEDSVTSVQTSIIEAEGTSCDTNHRDGGCSKSMAKEEKSLKSSIRREKQIKRELKNTLNCIKRQRKELTERRDEAASELAKTTEAVAVLERSVEKEMRRKVDLENELKLIQASNLPLKTERLKIQQGEEAQRSLNAEAQYFDLSDLQNATCNFSENFKIGRGGNGSVYKGELLNETVAIKKLHPNFVHLEFEQEVWILGNLRHPHLVPLIGICPEAPSLVSKYMPNGNLNDRLCRRSHTTRGWNWEERTRAASEIAAAVLFLHSSKPDEIIHGDLKPENIFFDSDFSCKIGDFGISRLVQEGSLHCPSFRRNSESTSPFSYSDPEYQRTRKLTAKSDVYSFGIIILQLLTGRPPTGLVNDVRRAMLEGKLPSMLDRSAGDWPSYVATRLAELGLQCCESNSRNRPELNDVLVRELEGFHLMEEQSAPVPDLFVCPILKEIMHDPHVAADGHTYEGKAFRNWIEHGHDTSPMTNVKLDNLNSTPNLSLRIAIQEWRSTIQS